MDKNEKDKPWNKKYKYKFMGYCINYIIIQKFCVKFVASTN